MSPFLFHFPTTTDLPSACVCILERQLFGSSSERRLPGVRLSWESSFLHPPCRMNCSGQASPWWPASHSWGPREEYPCRPTQRRMATEGWSVRSGGGSCGILAGPELTLGSPCEGLPACTCSPAIALSVQDAVPNSTSLCFLSRW